MLGRACVAHFCLAASCVGLLGCADAHGRLDAFEARSADVTSAAGSNGEGGAGGETCTPPAPGVISGPALLSLETATTPGKAILFFGNIETPEIDGHTAVKYTYQGVDAMDRKTLVGDELVVGPFVIQDDGTFDAPTGKAEIAGRADVLLYGVPITSALALHGTICGVKDFYCGTVDGQVYAPFEGPTTGQFGLALVPDIDSIPARPRFGCKESALAPELDPQAM
jgi:hypothetical protein